MIRIALVLIMFIGAMIWFADIIALIMGTYTFNPFNVGVASFIVGCYLVNVGVWLLNKKGKIL